MPETRPFSYFGSSPVWKRFTISVSLVIALFIIGIFLGVVIRNRSVMVKEVETRARSYFHNILLMRMWNASYGGVYVEKTPGIESNPYLDNPDIIGEDGKVYTKKNPALMTREISEMADKQGLFAFHITSLTPLNPGNVPDAFEREALQSFEKGVTEAHATQYAGGVTYFRYMAPLMADQSCMACHSRQGYKPGDIRGGISVRFDISDVQQANANADILMLVLAALTLLLLLGILHLFILQLMHKLKKAQAQLETMAATDPLTGLKNRRYLFEHLEKEFARARRYGTDLACLLVDLDHFKTVNDQHGHLAGDEVLRRFAHAVKGNTRTSDIAARFGGEEFILLLPGTGLEGARVTAEKLQAALKNMRFQSADGQAFSVSASFGCAATGPGGEPTPSPDAFILRADKALYLAKAEGRDCIRCHADAPPLLS